MKSIKRLLITSAGLAFLAVSTGCAGIMNDDARRATESEYKNTAAVSAELKNNGEQLEEEPSIFSGGWSIKYRPAIKTLSVLLFSGLSLAAYWGNEEVPLGLAVPVAAFFGYGAVSFPVHEDSDIYKWSVGVGTILGLATSVIFFVINADAINPNNGIGGGLWVIPVCLISTIVSTGIGGIVGDILDGMGLSDRKVKRKI